MNQFDTVVGQFLPARADDLRDDAREQIGKALEWFVAWTIEEGQYAGQFALVPKQPVMGWVPQCDVEIAS